MELLGVGASEFIFIVIIALIILGPKDMQKAGKMVGKFMRNIVTSDYWKMFLQTSSEIRTLPNKLMRDANEELNQIGGQLNNAVNLTPNRSPNLNNPGRSRAVSETPPIHKPSSVTESESKPNEIGKQKDA